jgi:energy-coupling factor transporter transmembrane protein EcfT
MVGSLFIRSIDTAEHINIAMQARGFDGKWNTISKLRVRAADFVFILSAALFVLGLYVFVRPALR